MASRVTDLPEDFHGRIEFHHDDGAYSVEITPVRPHLGLLIVIIFRLLLLSGFTAVPIIVLLFLFLSFFLDSSFFILPIYAFSLLGCAYLYRSELSQFCWRWMGREKLFIEDGWLHYEEYMGSHLRRTLEFELCDIERLLWMGGPVSRYDRQTSYRLLPISFLYRNETYKMCWDLRDPEAKRLIQFLVIAAHPHKL